MCACTLYSHCCTWILCQKIKSSFGLQTHLWPLHSFWSWNCWPHISHQRLWHNTVNIEWLSVEQLLSRLSWGWIRSSCKAGEKTSRESQQSTQSWFRDKGHRGRQSQKRSPTKSSLVTFQTLQRNICWWIWIVMWKYASPNTVESPKKMFTMAMSLS